MDYFHLTMFRTAFVANFTRTLDFVLLDLLLTAYSLLPVVTCQPGISITVSAGGQIWDPPPRYRLWIVDQLRVLGVHLQLVRWRSLTDDREFAIKFWAFTTFGGGFRLDRIVMVVLLLAQIRFEMNLCFKVEDRDTIHHICPTRVDRRVHYLTNFRKGQTAWT